MKKISHIKTVVLGILFLSVLASFAQDNKLFNEGNALYNEGKYAEAIDKYKVILDSGQHSAELYYNMGNAHYKLNNVAESVYYFEKALQLAPGDKEIQNNLAYAQNMTIDAIDVQPEVGFSKLFKNIINYLDYEVWAKLSIIFMALFVALFLWYYFSSNTGKKRVAFISFIVSLFCFAMTFSLAFQKLEMDKKNNPAIVFAHESSVKNDPNPNGQELFQLHEGTKVQILESFENWDKIKLSDGKIGWIRASDIKPL